MSQLVDEKCVPCKSGTPPMPSSQQQQLLAELGGGWQIERGERLKKRYEFPDFEAALAFVNKVGAVAEENVHHPDIYLAWGKVELEIWTHTIDGLSRADFVLAAKCDLVHGA